MARDVYTVVLLEKQWKVRSAGKHSGPYVTQTEAIAAAVQAAHKVGLSNPDGAQVRVQDTNNQFRTSDSQDPILPKADGTYLAVCVLLNPSNGRAGSKTKNSRRSPETNLGHDRRLPPSMSSRQQELRAGLFPSGALRFRHDGGYVLLGTPGCTPMWRRFPSRSRRHRPEPAALPCPAAPQRPPLRRAR